MGHGTWLARPALQCAACEPAVVVVVVLMLLFFWNVVLAAGCWLLDAGCWSSSVRVAVVLPCATQGR